MGFGTARGFPKKPKPPAMSVSVKTLVGQGVSLPQTNPTYTTTVS